MQSHDLAACLLAKPNVELIMQKDAEGNGYSPLQGIDFNVVYVPESTWSGEVFSTDYDAEDHCLEEAEWEELKAKHSGYAVLFPVN